MLSTAIGYDHHTTTSTVVTHVLCFMLVAGADDALQLTASSSGSESDSSSIAGTSTAADTADSISALTSLSSTDESSGGTIAERMQQQFEQKQNASQGVVAFKQRQQKRKEYMEQVGQVGGSASCAALCCVMLCKCVMCQGW